MTSGKETAYILAIDLGSGGPKVVLVSDQGELVGHTSGTIATAHGTDGASEQDPGQWWRVTGDCVRELIDRRLVPVEQIVAVSCASQWSVTVPVDRHGLHLGPAIHWSDSRGAVYTHRALDGWIKFSGFGVRRLLRWLRMTGGAPTQSGADALAHILFIKHERPDLYRQTDKFLEPMDYFNLRLTGRAAASMATVYPYLLTDNRDCTRIDYDPQLIAWSGLDRAKLPDLVAVGTVLGRMLPQIADEWGLSRDTQVVAGTPDSQAAALGSGAARDFEGHVCVGTSSWLSCHVPFKKQSIKQYIGTMPSAIFGRNMVVAEQGAAGKCWRLFVENWLCPRDELTPAGAPDDVYERLDRLAGAVPAGSEGLLFLPWLNGAGPPSGDGAMRGGFLNQSFRTGRSHAARAIMEGVAFNLRWLRESVEPFVGRRFESLRLVGGCARSDNWCQILADIIDRPLDRVVEPSMATSRGAALVALVALGYQRVDDLGRLTRIDRRFLPLARNRNTYEELFREFLNSYKANRPMFHRLNRRSRSTRAGDKASPARP